MKNKIIREGIFAVYKPKGPTSFDIIAAIRKKTGIQKIGHAGTLDPLARGVLVVGIGREATRRLALEVAKEKEYVARIRLGRTSATDDAEGEITLRKVSKRPVRRDIGLALKNFVGRIKQVPPIYSAIKIGGKAAYKLARKGKAVKLAPREVEIKSIKIISYRWPSLKIRVTTGPGVYIRALARDLGNTLGTGGYLADLERTRVGKYTRTRAIRLYPVTFLKLRGLAAGIPQQNVDHFRGV